MSERCEVEGDPPAGRMASEESVRLFRELATREPRFTPKLVAALKYLAKRCSAMGEHSQALAAAGEAVELAMNLATDEKGSGASSMRSTSWRIGSLWRAMRRALGRPPSEPSSGSTLPLHKASRPPRSGRWCVCVRQHS